MHILSRADPLPSTCLKHVYDVDDHFLVGLAKSLDGELDKNNSDFIAILRFYSLVLSTGGHGGNGLLSVRSR